MYIVYNLYLYCKINVSFNQIKSTNKLIIVHTSYRTITTVTIDIKTNKGVNMFNRLKRNKMSLKLGDLSKIEKLENSDL